MFIGMYYISTYIKLDKQFVPHDREILTPIKAHGQNGDLYDAVSNRVNKSSLDKSHPS